MKCFKIDNPVPLSRVLNVFSTLDDVRWSHAANYNLINHCSYDLSPDEKLLTHWLCYTTDRQIGFERVWEVGGYVISHLVRSFCQDKDAPGDILLAHLRYPDGKLGLRLECPLLAQNKRLAHFGIQKSPVRFSSRYMPSDVISIYRSLLMLDAVSGRSFVKYMHLAISGVRDRTQAMSRLAVALHFLSYADVGQMSDRGLRKRIKSLPKEIDSQIRELKADPASFFDRQQDRFSPYGKKRLWCALRDYLKSPEFNAYFSKAMAGIDLSAGRRWRRGSPGLREALSVIELPGDVWNNNRIFRDGLFSPYLSQIPNTWDMPKTVRAIYEAMPAGKTAFYPEQLDVTFDFVPRMCAKRNCHICIFGAGIADLCHRRAGKYCPVTLASCGYLHPCTPSACMFRNDRHKGLCKNAISGKPS